MQNLLNNTSTYRVGNEIYRRNCPIEKINTANPAPVCDDADDAITERQCIASSDEEQEQQIAETTNTKVVSTAVSTISPPPGFEKMTEGNPLTQQDVLANKMDENRTTDELSTTVQKHTMDILSKDGELFTLNKQEKIELVGTVKYDAKEEIYYDSLNVVSALIGMLRGRDRQKQKKLETKFDCVIHFPNKRSARSETKIRITSKQTAQHVKNCCEEIERSVVLAKKQAKPTHFISIPIFDSKLRYQYSELIKRICSDEELSKECKEPSIFMPTSKLHLTLNVLKLFTDEEIERVKQFLDELFKSDEIREIFHDAADIKIEFPMLEHFADRSPEKVSVIFAKAESEKMQRLANAVDDALNKNGLSEKRKTKDVILHMTVINTKYLWEKKRSFLNAKVVMEKFGQLNFDPVKVNELHLCEMKGSDDELNGYKSVHKIKFVEMP